MNEINLDTKTVITLIVIMSTILYLAINWQIAREEYQFKKDLQRAMKNKELKIDKRF